MADNNQTASVDHTGTPVIGIKTDVYERRWELIWMSKDDIAHFEARMGDKTLFQNIALFFISASAPLLIEKWIDYNASGAQTDLALVIVCIVGLGIGVLFQILALNRKRRLSSFKEELFQRERMLSTQFSMIDNSSSASGYSARSAM